MGINLPSQLVTPIFYLLPILILWAMQTTWPFGLSSGKPLLFFAFLVLPYPSLAQVRLLGTGARAAGLANTSVTVGDGWAVFNNVGALAWQREAQLLFAYENRFAVAGLNTVQAAGVYPFRWGGTGGLSLFRFGDALFNETALGLALGHHIGNYAIGLRANYVQLSLQGLGTLGRLVLEFGGTAQLTPKLWLGAHIYNANQAKVASFQDERLPTVMKAGLSYRPDRRLMLNAEVAQDLGFPTQVRAGAEYHLLERLAVRTGITTQPFTQSFGAGFALWAWQVDYALVTHPQLQPSHHLSLVYRFRRAVTRKSGEKPADSP
jgi:hypothetical protein